MASYDFSKTGGNVTSYDFKTGGDAQAIDFSQFNTQVVNKVDV